MAGRVENTSAPLVIIAQDPRSIFDKLFIANPLACDVSDKKQMTISRGQSVADESRARDLFLTPVQKAFRIEPKVPPCDARPSSSGSAAVPDHRIRRPEQWMRVAIHGTSRSVDGAGAVEQRHHGLAQSFAAGQRRIGPLAPEQVGDQFAG